MTSAYRSSLAIVPIKGKLRYVPAAVRRYGVMRLAGELQVAWVERIRRSLGLLRQRDVVSEMV